MHLYLNNVSFRTMEVYLHQPYFCNVAFVLRSLAYSSSELLGGQQLL